MTFRVAVLLAAYNGADWICAQIDSILGQAGVDVDLFVGDDFSIDATLEIIACTYGHNKRVSIVDKTRVRYGSPAANFFRLFASVSFEKYDYIFLADQDDYWHSTKITSAIEAMTTARVDCYASDLTCLYSDGKRKPLRKSYPQTRNDFLFQGASAGCTYGLSRRAANLCKDSFTLLTDEQKKVLSHDWTIYAITRSNSLDWVLDQNIYIDYRQHGANAYGALGWGSYIKRLRLLKSGWYRKSIIALADICFLNSEQLKIISALKRWGWKDRVFVLSRSWSLRRRPVEKIYVMMLIIFNAL
ncbi:glycosyltransferase [Variovorax paradoxus]|uniref:glycosyltransferase n=1 Tax=Variovorax paradoxus TaxID=34073 RepID=UPI003ECCF4BF